MQYSLDSVNIASWSELSIEESLPQNNTEIFREAIYEFLSQQLSNASGSYNIILNRRPSDQAATPANNSYTA